MVSAKVLALAGLAATAFGTTGGVLEMFAAPGRRWYKVGVVLASIGVDLTSLVTKLSGAS